MTWDQIAGNWKQFKGEIKRQFGKLTDDDLTVAEGHRDQLIGRLQERYGYSRDEADRQLSAWERNVH